MTKMKNLVERLKSCKQFRWKSDMLTTSGVRIISIRDGWAIIDNPICLNVESRFRLHDMSGLPSLFDPPTLGYILHFAREAWDDHGLAVIGLYRYGVGWEWGISHCPPTQLMKVELFFFPDVMGVFVLRLR